MTLKKYAGINRRKNYDSVRGSEISSSSPAKIRRFRIWCNEFLRSGVRRFLSPNAVHLLSKDLIAPYRGLNRVHITIFHSINNVKKNQCTLTFNIDNSSDKNLKSLTEIEI